MTGVIFVGMLPPNSHNPEERRFVEELASRVPRLRYLRGIGIKGLQLHQLRSIPSRIAALRLQGRRRTNRDGSLFIIPCRTGLARKVNTRWLRRQLIELTAGRPQDWILWTRFPSPELVDALESLVFARIVYEPIDRYAAAEDLSVAERHSVAQAEERLSRRALVVTGALALAEWFRTAAGGSHWLPFGYDLCRRSIGEGIPASISGPKLCVVGEFDWRMDEALLCRLATKHREWHLVLAGPRRRPWGNRLAQFANVHWLGRIPSSRVGPVIADAEVALIPYRLTDWTRACLPVKVFEYLAEAKPVVATPLPELSLFKDVVTLATPQKFESAIAQAILQSGPTTREHRRQAALRYTLQARASQAVRLLQDELSLAPTA